MHFRAAAAPAAYHSPEAAALDGALDRLGRGDAVGGDAGQVLDLAEDLHPAQPSLALALSHSASSPLSSDYSKDVGLCTSSS